MNYMNLTLQQYLRIRHSTVNALTRVEAGILGINYPLESGWIESYSEDIPHERLCELLAAREKRYASKSYKKSKAKSVRNGKNKKRGKK